MPVPTLGCDWSAQLSQAVARGSTVSITTHAFASTWSGRTTYEKSFSTIDESVLMQENTDRHEDWNTTEEDVFDGDDSFSTITSAPTAVTGTSSNSTVTCARRPKRKAKDSSSSSCDPSIDSLASYFTAKCERLQSIPIETKSNMDEDELYGKVVSTDMKKIKNERIKRRLRKNISDLIYAALEE